MIDITKSQIRRRMKQDLFLTFIVFSVGLAVFLQLDLLEAMYYFSRNHENWELDEIVPTIMLLTLVLAVFSYRRMRDLKTLSRVCEEQSLKHSITHYPNRRALDRLLLYKFKESDFPLSLIMVDMVGLRQVTVNYGLSVADEVLKRALEEINRLIPEDAIVGHWASEQLLIYAPKLKAADKRDLLEIVDGLNIQLSQHQTLDLGFCCVDVTIDESKKLNTAIEQLEDALYVAHASFADNKFGYQEAIEKHMVRESSTI